MRRSDVRPCNELHRCIHVEQRHKKLLNRLLTLKYLTRLVGDLRLKFLRAPEDEELSLFVAEGDAQDEKTKRKERMIFKRQLLERI